MEHHPALLCCMQASTAVKTDNTDLRSILDRDGLIAGAQGEALRDSAGGPLTLRMVAASWALRAGLA